jgi:serine/threonine protein kinase
MTTGIQKIIGNRYQIITLLGEGGFGKTYLAEDLYQLGSQYAVKHFTFSSNNLNEATKARELFQREVEALQKLNGHPQIPKFFDNFEENQEFYLVQEFIDGHSLSDEIESLSQLEETEVLRILQDLLKVLEFVHGNNIIHRDINPSNILKCRDGKLVLIDFGAVKEVIAKTKISSIQQPGTKIYTQGYAPREQMYGYPEFNSDIYALGMTVIQALTGFEPKDLPIAPNGELFWQDKVQVSDKLKRIVSKMVCDDCRNRYQSVKEVLSDLEEPAVVSSTTLVIIPPISLAQKNQMDIVLYAFLPICIIIMFLYSLGLLPEKKDPKPKSAITYQLSAFMNASTNIYITH